MKKSSPASPASPASLDGLNASVVKNGKVKDATDITNQPNVRAALDGALRLCMVEFFKRATTWHRLSRGDAILLTRAKFASVFPRSERAFYRFLSRYELGGAEALKNRNPGRSGRKPKRKEVAS